MTEVDVARNTALLAQPPAAYLTKIRGEVTLNIYGVGSEPQHLPAPAWMADKPNDVQLWAEEELTSRGVYVKEWATPEGYDTWADAEYDYKASMGALPPASSEPGVQMTPGTQYGLTPSADTGPVMQVHHTPGLAADSVVSPAPPLVQGIPHTR